MNSRMNKTILSLVIAALTLTAVSVEVSAAEKSIQVSKKYTKSMTYEMEVSLSSGGSFFDGQKEIEGGKESIIYDLTLGENATKYKEFEIRPKSGYRLVGLTYTEPEIDPDKVISIIDQVKDGKFSLPVKSTKMVLNAVFEKIEDGSGDGSGGGGSGGSGSGSGDSGGSSGSGTSGGSSTAGGTGSTGTAGTTGGSSGTGAGGTSQTGTSTAATGDNAMIGWHVAIMLTAVTALMIIAAKKRKTVYKGS